MAAGVRSVVSLPPATFRSDAPPADAALAGAGTLAGAATTVAAGAEAPAGAVTLPGTGAVPPAGAATLAGATSLAATGAFAGAEVGPGVAFGLAAAGAFATLAPVDAPAVVASAAGLAVLQIGRAHV